MKGRGPVLVMLIGAVAAIVGTAGLAAGWGGATTTIRTAPGESSPSTTTSPPSTGETPAQFLASLAQAFRETDATFLYARLNPAVLARYGEATCRAYVAVARDPTARFQVVSVGAPERYSWTTDNQTTAIPETLPVTVDRTAAGQTSRTVVHLTPVGGRLSWFTDCTPG